MWYIVHLIDQGSFARYYRKDIILYKKRLTLLILLLIVACFIFQLVPVTPEGVTSYVCHVKDSKVLLYAGSIYDSTHLIGRSDFKTKFNKVTIMHTLVFTQHISLTGISLSKSFLPVIPFDHRTAIRQSIPHYFNGTKYKNNLFAV